MGVKRFQSSGGEALFTSADIFYIHASVVALMLFYVYNLFVRFVFVYWLSLMVLYQSKYFIERQTYMF